MSTAGSGPDPERPAGRPPTPADARPGARSVTPPSPVSVASPARRTSIIRWRGLIPLALGLVLLLIGWLVFGEPIAEDTTEEALTKALGTQVDIEDFRIDELRTTIVMRGVAVAHPFDVNRNLIEAGRLRFEFEAEQLLERKLIVERLGLADVRTGTRRAMPARPVQGGGFAPSALRELDRWADQFRVPLLSLTPIDTIRAIA